jgi:hypothetical protein
MAVTPGGTLVWNGSKWGSPMPSGVGFSAVTCATAKFCIGALNGVTYTVWHGQKWHTVSSPNSSDDTNIIEGMSCASAKLCLAFGTSYDTEGNPDGGFLDQWNGSAWKLAGIPATDASALSALSCVHGSWCLALGSDVVVRFSAGKWLITRPAQFRAGDYTVLSCASASMCMALDNGETALWNGKTWQLGKVTHDPGELFGLSCTGRSFCLAVGQRSGLLGLSESWNGHSWKVLTQPNP